MSKSGEIRHFVKSHPGCDLEKIATGTELPLSFVRHILRQREKVGEFTIEDGCVTFCSDFVRPRGSGLGKKVRGNRAELRAARKVKKPVKSLHELALKHAPVVTVAVVAQATWAALREILDLDGAEPMLVSSFKAHAAAMDLLAAS